MENYNMLECSFCQSTESIQLIGCCISFGCSRCIQAHKCSDPFEIIDLQNQLTSKIILKCTRCADKSAVTRCLQCKGRQFCEQCLQSVHEGKYKSHQFSSIGSEKIFSLKSSFCLSKQAKQNSQIKLSTAEKESKRDALCSEKLKTQIQINLSNTHNLKIEIQQKWLKYRQQVQSYFDHIRQQLEKKNTQILQSIQKQSTSELRLVENRIQQLNSALKALKCLQNLNQINQSKLISSITKSKRKIFDKNLLKWNKAIESKPFIQYKSNQQATTSLLEGINNLKLLQRIKIIRDLSQSLKSSIRDSSKSLNKPRKLESSPVFTPPNHHNASLIQQDCYGLYKSNQQNRDRSQRSISNSQFVRKSYISPRNVIVERNNTSRSPGIKNIINSNRRVFTKQASSRSIQKTQQMPSKNTLSSKIK